MRISINNAEKYPQIRYKSLQDILQYPTGSFGLDLNYIVLFHQLASGTDDNIVYGNGLAGCFKSLCYDHG